MDHRRVTGAEVEDVGGRSAVRDVVLLETATQRVVEHAEVIDEVRFPRAVGADENVERTQFDVRLLDRAEAFDVELAKLFHGGVIAGLRTELAEQNEVASPFQRRHLFCGCLRIKPEPKQSTRFGFISEPGLDDMRIEIKSIRKVFIGNSVRIHRDNILKSVLQA